MQRLKGAHLLLQAIARARQLDPGVRITAELYGARSGADDYDPRAIATRLELDEVVHLA
ncbi:glycosyl transferase, partial [Glutamicibacter creatinolyticus]